MIKKLIKDLEKIEVPFQKRFYGFKKLFLKKLNLSRCVWWAGSCNKKLDLGLNND